MLQKMKRKTFSRVRGTGRRRQDTALNRMDKVISLERLDVHKDFKLVRGLSDRHLDRGRQRQEGETARARP